MTDAETEERAALRQEYLNAVMANARSVLENTYIVDENRQKRNRRLWGKGESGKQKKSYEMSKENTTVRSADEPPKNER